jgi:hypothetical protein
MHRAGGFDLPADVSGYRCVLSKQMDFESRVALYRRVPCESLNLIFGDVVGGQLSSRKCGLMVMKPAPIDPAKRDLDSVQLNELALASADMADVPPTVTHVIGPRGRRLTLNDLPVPDTVRWVIRRKAEVVAAVRGGLLSMEEACSRYALNSDEFRSWQDCIDRFGLAGLRTTRTQFYLKHLTRTESMRFRRGASRPERMGS